MVALMRLPASLLCIALIASVSSTAAPLAKPEWNRVQIDPMKTSIYVGNVTLTTTPFKRDGNSFTATYVAKVFPWFFWGESGQISINIAETDLQKLQQGERCEFTGEAFNHKQKPRKISGYADPATAQNGRTKVRIGVDDLELIFNGPYTLSTFTKQAETTPKE